MGEGHKSKNLMRGHFLTAFWISLIVSLSLMIGGFLTPPSGQIHGSVITSCGLLFLWPTLACGAKAIEEGRTARFHTKHGSLVVGDDSKEV